MIKSVVSLVGSVKLGEFVLRNPLPTIFSLLPSIRVELFVLSVFCILYSDY